jgi:hypothetical protein
MSRVGRVRKRNKGKKKEGRWTEGSEPIMTTMARRRMKEQDD